MFYTVFQRSQLLQGLTNPVFQEDILFHIVLSFELKLEKLYTSALAKDVNRHPLPRADLEACDNGVPALSKICKAHVTQYSFTRVTCYVR